MAIRKWNLPSIGQLYKSRNFGTNQIEAYLKWFLWLLTCKAPFSSIEVRINISRFWVFNLRPHEQLYTIKQSEKFFKWFNNFSFEHKTFEEILQFCSLKSFEITTHMIIFFFWYPRKLKVRKSNLNGAKILKYTQFHFLISF